MRILAVRGLRGDFFVRAYYARLYMKKTGNKGLWHNICILMIAMVALHSQNVEYNVLVSGANWAWPVAQRELFKPREVNLMVAEKTDDFVEVIRRRRIHTAIVDMDSTAVALATVKIIRIDFPLVPCILLAGEAGENLLSKALHLDVFSVIEKPVDMELLREQLNRLFLKRYNSNIFQRIEQH